MLNNKKYSILVIILVVLNTILLLHLQGRSFISNSGKFFIWVGSIWSSESSQQLFDPYSFTHLMHGFIFCWLISWLLTKIPHHWQLTIVVAMESLWELVENSNPIINRYREATMALGYRGDTIINSLSDILMCSLGFLLAKKLGLRKSIILFFLTEIFLLFWIRDNLILNIVMLLYPIEKIKHWQMMK